MHWVVVITYPMSKIAEVIPLYLDQVSNDPLPDWIEEVGFFSQFGGDGVRNWAIYSAPDERSAEALKKLVNSQMRYAGVDGFKIEYETVMPVMEAIATATGQA